MEFRVFCSTVASACERKVKHKRSVSRRTQRNKSAKRIKQKAAIIFPREESLSHRGLMMRWQARNVATRWKTGDRVEDFFSAELWSFFVV